MSFWLDGKATFEGPTASIFEAKKMYLMRDEDRLTYLAVLSVISV